jgi:hypothetical protein
MSDLTTVNNTLKEQNDLLKGNRSQELENKREQDRKDAEMLKILRGLKPTVALDGKKSKDSFLMSVLKGFGLIGAGAAGLATGLLQGWLGFVGRLIKTVGKLVFKFIDMIPRPQWLDDFIAAFGKEGKIGKTFMKIKNFFIGETSIFKKIGKAVDSAVDGLKTFQSGAFSKIKNFFVGETSIFKKIGKLIDPVIDSLKAFKGGIFTKIANFFVGEGSIFKRMKTAIDPVIDIVKGVGGGIFTTIGNVFQSIKNFASSVAAPFKSIGSLFGGGAKAAKGGGLVKTIMGVLSPMKVVFKAMAGLGRILGAPLTIIMGLIDAGFETKDAVEKSEGFFASILNGIFGAIGGFIDGAFLQVADLLKDGIAWIAGFFGFTEIEEELNSFSFSKIFNDMLDKVYEFVNKLFNNPMEMLRDISESVLGTKITNTLFGKKNADVTVEDFYGMTDIGKKEIDTDALSKRLGMMSVDEIRSLAGNFAGLEKGFENKDAVEKAFEMAMKSRMNAAATGGGKGATINNFNTVDNSVKSSQSTTLNAPANARQTEPTLVALKN